MSSTNVSAVPTIRHATLQRQIREIRLSQQLRLLRTQRQDTRQ
ncbi:MAG: hypothetical protein QM760_18370 [Nibricoccus sp.]